MVERDREGDSYIRNISGTIVKRDRGADRKGERVQKQVDRKERERERS